MSQFDDIDIFAGPERDMMGVPITGSSRDRQLDALEGMARQRYIDPVENRAKDMVKMQVAEALSNVPGIKGEAISSIIALADSQNPDDKLMFNQIVSRLDLPVDVRRMGDDYAVSKRFEDVLGDNSSVGVSAYLPDEGDDQYSLSAEKRFPNFLGGEARVGGNISTGGDPEIRASFMRRFAGGGDVDIFDDPNRDPYYEELGLSFDNERGQYFEVIEHPEYGFMRSYVSPRDQASTPELSGARTLNDQLVRGQASRDRATNDFESMITAQAKILADSYSYKDLQDRRYELERKRARQSGISLEPTPMSEEELAVREAAQISMRNKFADSKGGGGVGDLEMESFKSYANGGDVDIFEDQDIPADMYRRDGSIKSAEGYLGPVTNKNDGKTMTELSIGVQIDGREVEIPAMVPTLNDAEIEMLRNIRVGIDPIPRSIQQKAVEHARPFLEAGESPFFKGYANGGDVDLYDADIFESPLDRLTQPVRGDLGPMQQIVAEEEGLRGKAKRLLAGAMGDDRQAYRRAGKLLGAADLTPVLGDVAAVADVSDAYRAGDPVGLGLAALGFIPGIGGTLSKAGKGLRGAPSISSEGIPQPPKISKKEAVPLLKQQFIEEQPPTGSFDEATGKPVTEKLNRDRANAYERSIVKGPPAVFRRELFRLGSKVERQPLAERKIINPEVLKDYVGVPVVGDMSARIKNPTSQPYPEDAGILSVRGVPLSRRVIPEGGFQFTTDSEGAEKGWSSMEGIATKKQGNIILAAEQTGKDPIGIFSAMGAESMDFTSPTLEMMIAQIPAIRIPKADLSAFDKVIREGTKTVKPRPQWVGLDSPDVFNQILGEGGFDRGGAGALRIDLLAEMKKDRWKKLGFPIYDDAYETMKAQEFDEAVKNSTGLSMYRADPNRGVFDEPYHKSYNKTFPAMKDQEYLGGLIEGTPPEIMFPDTFKDLSQRINRAGEPFTYGQQTGSLVMNPKLYEEYDDEKIQGIIDYLNEYAGTDYAEGGAVNVDDIDIFGER